MALLKPVLAAVAAYHLVTEPVMQTSKAMLIFQNFISSTSQPALQDAIGHRICLCHPPGDSSV